MGQLKKNAFLPDGVRLSQVHLRTARLERAVGFYQRELGLKVVESKGATAALSAAGQGPVMLALKEEPAAAPRPARATGLYHFALRYPTRQGLAEAYRRVSESGYAVEGASDHGVSEAIYLKDPDGNGVELYADRPRDQWLWRDGQLMMSVGSLDLDDLLGSTKQGRQAPDRSGFHSSLSYAAGTQEAELGHIHLHVAELSRAERFYREFLGLAVTQRSLPGALFFAAGGYHHHVGVNTWAGPAAAPAESVGLISYRFEVPVAEILYCLTHRAPLLGYEARTQKLADGSELLQIRDPNENWLEVHRPAQPEIRGRNDE